MEKQIKKEEIKKMKNQLNQDWNLLLKTYPDKNHFANFVRSLESPSLQKKTLKMFLKTEGLEFEDCYGLAELVMTKIKGLFLKRAFWEKCFVLALSEDWVKVIKYEKDETIKEIFWTGLERRIKKGFILEKQGRQILIQIFKETPEEKTRKKTWQLLRTLHPPEKDLLEISGLECMRSMIKIAEEIRCLVNKIKQEKPIAEQKTKLFQQIIDRINQNVKKLEQIKKGQE